MSGAFACARRIGRFRLGGWRAHARGAALIRLDRNGANLLRLCGTGDWRRSGRARYSRDTGRLLTLLRRDWGRSRADSHPRDGSTGASSRDTTRSALPPIRSWIGFAFGSFETGTTLLGRGSALITGGGTARAGRAEHRAIAEGRGGADNRQRQHREYGHDRAAAARRRVIFRHRHVQAGTRRAVVIAIVVTCLSARPRK